MLKRMTFVTVALAIVSLGLLAACNSKTPEEKAQSFVNHSARKFDLTDYQKARLLEVASVALDLRAELTKDQDELNVELINMFVSDQLDQPRINQVLTEKEEIFRTYSRLLITRVAEFHDSLSPQQRREIAEILRNTLGDSRIHRGGALRGTLRSSNTGTFKAWATTWPSA